MRNIKRICITPILLILVFLPRESLGKNVRIYEFHPSQTDKPKIVKETIEKTEFIVRARAPFTGEKPNILFFRYFYTDPDGTLKRLSEVSYDGKSRKNFKTESLVDDAMTHSYCLFLRVTDYHENQVGDDSIDLLLHREVEVIYNGNTKHITYGNWERVSSEIFGGNDVCSVTYSEQTKQERTRSFTISPSISIDLPIINLALGFDIQEKATSESCHKLEINKAIPPNESGCWYRRWEEIERQLEIFKYNIIGQRTKIGKICVRDWLFSPYLRITRNGKWEELPNGFKVD